MALAIIPAIIVSFVVLVAFLGTYYIYQAYRRVRFSMPDIERTRHIENIDQFQQQPIELRDLEHPKNHHHSVQRYISKDVVPANAAPVARPLPHILEIEYTGGEGLVSTPGRVFLSTEEIKASSRGRTRETDYFQEQDVHAGKTWNFETNGYGNSMAQPELLSPKPVRTVTRKPKAEPASTAYDSDQTAASDTWNKIEKGELQPSRRKAEKKLPKVRNASVPEVLRDPSEFESDVLQDSDLGSSTKEWAKANRPAQPPNKRPSKRESFDSVTTVTDANNVNIERPQSYIKRKQSIDAEFTKPPQPLDRAAEARRQISERKRQMAERQKQEEEERLAEERRQEEEQKQRAAEHQRLAEENQRQRDEERARSLAQSTDTEDVDSYDTTTHKTRRPSTGRRSNTSIESKRERKSRERPLTRSLKRAYTFANDAPHSLDESPTNPRSGSSGDGNARSMSMNDQTRPDFNATMPSITEGTRADGNNKMHTDPFSDKAARRSYGSTRTVSSMYSANYEDRAVSKDVPENPFTSYDDPEDAFVGAQRSSAASSNESRVSFPEAQRRSNASSNDSKISSDSRQGTNYSKRSDGKSSAKTRASVDSQSSQQSAVDREKPVR